MNKFHDGIRTRFGIVEVWLDVKRTENLLQILARVHSTLSDFVDAATIAEQLRGKLLELSCVVGQTGVVVGLRTCDHCAILHQGMDGSQHGK